MGECTVCGRYGPGLPTERHHLVPENRADSPVAEVCTPCHRQIHALFTNEELAEEYHTVPDLRDADRMRGYLDWIRGTRKTDVPVRTSAHVRRERRS